MDGGSSRALPRGRYGNPADIVERDELNRAGCSVCCEAVVVFDRVRCGSDKNVQQRGVPGIGHRCRFFKLKG